MSTVVTVVGARPQFVKAAVVSRELRDRPVPPYEDVLVHTGQHYDHGMSQVFFDELDIPEPDENLDIPGGSHGAATGAMLSALERVMMERRPDAVVVYGDTNSTLAAALAAAKLHIPIAHVEAGLRSYNRRMPEEINRVLTDHVSSLLFCPSERSAKNLASEGITEGVEVVGDTMFDAVRYYVSRAESAGVDAPYVVATIHRAENTDDRERLERLLRGLSRAPVRVILPLHPRTRNALERWSLELPESVSALAPQSYLEMLGLLAGSLGVLTDSGGVQKEAFFLQKPCLTLRNETEWTELVDIGANRLVGTDPELIQEGFTWMESTAVEGVTPYGDGQSAREIVNSISRLAQTSSPP